MDKIVLQIKLELCHSMTTFHTLQGTYHTNGGLYQGA